MQRHVHKCEALRAVTCTLRSPWLCKSVTHVVRGLKQEEAGRGIRNFDALQSRLLATEIICTP